MRVTCAAFFQKIQDLMVYKILLVVFIAKIITTKLAREALCPILFAQHARTFHVVRIPVHLLGNAVTAVFNNVSSAAHPRSATLVVVSIALWTAVISGRVLAVALKRRPARDVAMMALSFENANIASTYIRVRNAKR